MGENKECPVCGEQSIEFNEDDEYRYDQCVWCNEYVPIGLLRFAYHGKHGFVNMIDGVYGRDNFCDNPIVARRLEMLGRGNDDVEYFQNKLMSALGIPSSYLGIDIQHVTYTVDFHFGDSKDVIQVPPPEGEEWKLSQDIVGRFTGGMIIHESGKMMYGEYRKRMEVEGYCLQNVRKWVYTPKAKEFYASTKFQMDPESKFEGKKEWPKGNGRPGGAVVERKELIGDWKS